ncbi:hypothetical protein R3P38DRAFT_2994032 [Favolaschia claudopus]|uniref:Uncharacterized protein n=1 Tax=Favolaschia claudopus TaxID=2862362 RepID=A0AAW0AV30_9AGAR
MTFRIHTDPHSLLCLRLFYFLWLVGAPDPQERGGMSQGAREGTTQHGTNLNHLEMIMTTLRQEFLEPLYLLW